MHIYYTIILIVYSGSFNYTVHRQIFTIALVAFRASEGKPSVQTHMDGHIYIIDELLTAVEVSSAPYQSPMPSELFITISLAGCSYSLKEKST